MLRQILSKVLESHLNGIFFIISVVAFAFICYCLYLYLKKKKKKLPISVMLLSGLTVFIGVESVIIAFIIQDEQSALFYVFLAKVVLFFAGMVEIFLGMFLAKLKTWARTFILWVIVIFGLFDMLMAITGSNFNNLAADVGIYSIIITIYYLGLNKIYFKKENEGFSLHSDAATKKKAMNYFDWLNE